MPISCSLASHCYRSTTRLDAAETMQPSSVATLDAIHLVTAVRLADEQVIDTVMTYDTKLADGARQHGLTVIAPS